MSDGAGVSGGREAGPSTAEDGVTVNVANIRRAVFDAEDEYRRALRVVSDEDAAAHRDELLAKWLTNLGLLRSFTEDSA